MQVRWEYLTPVDFNALAKKEKLCILPIGSLERHGEHLPFGTDALTAHAIAVRAAEQEPCVVFPPYWFGQVHEASCFTGTVNFDSRLLLEILETVLDQIAANGFEKILILNTHGGNTNFLQYFAISHCDREANYTLYIRAIGENIRAFPWESTGIHAGEPETSIMMAVAPESVKMEYHRFKEPIEPLVDINSSLEVFTGYGWYGKHPEHVSGCPSLGSREKGEKFLEQVTRDIVNVIRKIKADTVTPSLRKEFYERRRRIKE